MVNTSYEVRISTSAINRLTQARELAFDVLKFRWAKHDLHGNLLLSAIKNNMNSRLIISCLVLYEDKMKMATKWIMSVEDHS